MKNILKHKPKLLIAVPYIDSTDLESTLRGYGYNIVIRKNNLFAS